MINEYGDDGFADPETDIDFSEPEPEVLTPVTHEGVETNVVVSPDRPATYVLRDRDGNELLVLPGDKPWAVVLEDGQYVTEG